LNYVQTLIMIHELSQIERERERERDEEEKEGAREQGDSLKYDILI